MAAKVISSFVVVIVVSLLVVIVWTLRRPVTSTYLITYVATESTSLSPIPFALEDADALEAVAGIDTSTRVLRLANLEDHLQDVTKHDILVLYIVAHFSVEPWTTEGPGVPTQVVIAGAPTQASDRMSVDRLLELLYDCPAKTKLLILDPAETPWQPDLQTNDMISAISRALQHPAGEIENSFNEETVDPRLDESTSSLQIMVSRGGNAYRFIIPTRHRSAFGVALEEALLGAADGFRVSDFDNAEVDGRISVGELFSFVTERMAEFQSPLATPQPFLFTNSGELVSGSGDLRSLGMRDDKILRRSQIHENGAEQPVQTQDQSAGISVSPSTSDRADKPSGVAQQVESAGNTSGDGGTDAILQPAPQPALANRTAETEKTDTLSLIGESQLSDPYFHTAIEVWAQIDELQHLESDNEGNVLWSPIDYSPDIWDDVNRYALSYEQLTRAGHAYRTPVVLHGMELLLSRLREYSAGVNGFGNSATYLDGSLDKLSLERRRFIESVSNQDMPLDHFAMNLLALKRHYVRQTQLARHYHLWLIRSFQLQQSVSPINTSIALFIEELADQKTLLEAATPDTLWRLRTRQLRITHIRDQIEAWFARQRNECLASQHENVTDANRLLIQLDTLRLTPQTRAILLQSLFAEPTARQSDSTSGREVHAGFTDVTARALRTYSISRNSAAEHPMFASTVLRPDSYIQSMLHELDIIPMKFFQSPPSRQLDTRERDADVQPVDEGSRAPKRYPISDTDFVLGALRSGTNQTCSGDSEKIYLRPFPVASSNYSLYFQNTGPVPLQELKAELWTRSKEMTVDAAFESLNEDGTPHRSKEIRLATADAQSIRPGQRVMLQFKPEQLGSVPPEQEAANDSAQPGIVVGEDITPGLRCKLEVTREDGQKVRVSRVLDVLPMSPDEMFELDVRYEMPNLVTVKARFRSDVRISDPISLFGGVDHPLSLSWRTISQFSASGPHLLSGQFNLGAGESDPLYATAPPDGTRRCVVVDMDNYPRAFLYSVRCADGARGVSLRRAVRDIRIAGLAWEGAAEDVIDRLGGNSLPRANVTESAGVSAPRTRLLKAMNKRLLVLVQADAPTGYFDADRDQVEVALIHRAPGGGMTRRFTMGHKVTTQLTEITADGSFTLESRVRDLLVPFDVSTLRDNTFRIKARLLGAKSSAIASDMIDVTLDNQPPRVLSVVVEPDRNWPVVKGDLVTATVVTEDSSGIADVRLQVESRNEFKLDPSKTEILGSSMASQIGDAVWTVQLPTKDLEEGAYAVRAIVHDTVGWMQESDAVPFEVADPEPTEELPAPEIRGTVKGVVKYGVLRPAGMSVQLDGTEYESTTDEGGRFYFLDIPPGPYKVLAEGPIRGIIRSASLDGVEPSDPEHPETLELLLE